MARTKASAIAEGRAKQATAKKEKKQQKASPAKPKGGTAKPKASTKKGAATKGGVHFVVTSLQEYPSDGFHSYCPGERKTDSVSGCPAAQLPTELYHPIDCAMHACLHAPHTSGAELLYTCMRAPSSVCKRAPHTHMRCHKRSGYP